MSIYKSFLVATIVVVASVTSIAQSSNLPYIVAGGTAEIEVVPDLATVTLSVVSKAPTAAAALAANAATSKDILDSLVSEFRLEKTDYRNSVSQSDDVVYDKESQQQKIVGQIATNTITVRTTHLDKIGEIIDLVTAKGAKEQYTSYGLVNPQGAKEQALSKATVNALANAQASLTPLGKKLGHYLGLQQSGAEAPIRRFAANERAMAAAAAPGGGPSTQVNAGLITVSASITLLYSVID